MSRSNKNNNKNKMAPKSETKLREIEIRNITDELFNKVEKVESRHAKSSEAVKAVQAQSERLVPGSKLSNSAKNKLLILHGTAKKQIETENANLRALLDDIAKLRELNFQSKLNDGQLARGPLMLQLAQHATTLPLYIGSITDHPPPLVGAIPLPEEEPIPIGDFVAAYMEDIWILGEVKKQVDSKNYEIRDIDEGIMDSGKASTSSPSSSNLLTLPSAKLIVLPHFRADPRRDAHALFPPQAIVLALYPQTTCFYKGVVQAAPQLPTDDYQIAFEDSTYPTGLSPSLPVPQRYVIPFKDVPEAPFTPFKTATTSTHTPGKRGRRKKTALISQFFVS